MDTLIYIYINIYKETYINIYMYIYETSAFYEPFTNQMPTIY